MPLVSNVKFNWREAIYQTYNDLSQELVQYMPKIIGALALLLCGYLVARLLRVLSQKFFVALDNLFRRATLKGTVQSKPNKNPYEILVGKFVFWAVLLFFIAASTNLLGWKLFTNWMEHLVRFLPSLVSGLLVIIAGFIIGNISRTGIASASDNLASNQSKFLSQSVRVVIIFASFIIGLEQVGLNVQFLTSIAVVFVGVILAGVALAFSLGAKNMVSNFIGAQHTRKHCRIGEYMKIGEFEGEVIEVSQTSIVLESSSGRILVPAKYFHNEIMVLNSEAPLDESINPKS